MKDGFTLAEVLVTLGIIGIVAAMTIPTIMLKHRKNVAETRLKKFYSSINQALNLSENVNGEKKYWKEQILNAQQCKNKEDEECLIFFFNTYLEPYLKHTEYKYVKGSGLLLYLADGSCIRIKHPFDYYFYPQASDVNKENAVRGSDFFPFQFGRPYGGKACLVKEFLNKGIEPYIDDNWDCTPKGLYGSPYSSAKLIQYNGWKIPNDYPWFK